MNTYLYQTEDQLVITQQIISMKYIFRGWVVKNWTNVNQEASQIIEQVNKIIVKESVSFYSKSWVQRNEVFHNEDHYRSFIINWYKRVKKEMLKGNRPEM